MARVSARRQIARGQHPPRIGAHQQRAIAPVAHEVGDRTSRARIIRLARPRASAPSVPGRTRSQISALLARPAWRGSITIRRMPRFFAATVAVAWVRRVMLGL